MYTLQLQFFPPPFLLLRHEDLDIVLNAIQHDPYNPLFKKKKIPGVPVVAHWYTSIHEDVALIPGFTQWAQ